MRNELLKKVLGLFVRHGLTVAATWMVAHKLLGPNGVDMAQAHADDVTLWIVMYAVPYVWSFKDKKNAIETTAVALNAPKGASIGEVRQVIAEAPKSEIKQAVQAATITSLRPDERYVMRGGEVVKIEEP